MEETRGNQLSSPILCKNGCGFFGSPNFEDLCSKCYRDLRSKEEIVNTSILSSCSSSSVNISHEVAATSTASSVSSVKPSSPVANKSSVSERLEFPTTSPTSSDSSPDTSKSKKNRCTVCRKKLGLTGFECRCGGLFCSTHRYADGHGCTFDYKSMGQEQIRKANPVVVGQKVNKI